MVIQTLRVNRWVLEVLGFIEPVCCVRLQAKYIGTGHADLSRFEWAVNIHRDSYASYIGHHPILSYFALAENESIGRVKYSMTQKMLLPCGVPPEKEEEI